VLREGEIRGKRGIQTILRGFAQAVPRDTFRRDEGDRVPEDTQPPREMRKERRSVEDRKENYEENLLLNLRKKSRSDRKINEWIERKTKTLLLLEDISNRNPVIL